MDGIILVDKPAGITSAEVVRRIKAMIKPARVGHLGTLDPFASGILPILVGEATKLAQFLGGAAKEYKGLIRLGAETDTLDPTGATVRTAEIPQLDRVRLKEIAASFTGVIEQIPPVFSAIKRDGVRLYDLARRGGEVEPPAARRVEIRRLELEARDSSSIGFALECSPGTYVRSLARDIGLALESAAHLEELCRTRNGAFSIEAARPLDHTIAALRERRACGIVGMREALADMPEVEIDLALERRLRNGDSRALDGIVPAGAVLFKVIAGGCLLAIARADSPARARLVRGFSADD
jgi:tRNA pseudouridine55 synthase